MTTILTTLLLATGTNHAGGGGDSGIVDTVVEAVDHAAAMNDRWMFIAILIVFLVALGIAMRWLVNYFTKRQDVLETEIRELRADQVSYIRTEGAKTSALLERCVNVLDRIKLP